MAAQILALILAALDALRAYQGGELTQEQLAAIRSRTQAKVDHANQVAAEALGETVVGGTGL